MKYTAVGGVGHFQTIATIWWSVNESPTDHQGQGSTEDSRMVSDGEGDKYPSRLPAMVIAMKRFSMWIKLLLALMKLYYIFNWFYTWFLSQGNLCTAKRELRLTFCIVVRVI